MRTIPYRADRAELTCELDRISIVITMLTLGGNGCCSIVQVQGEEALLASVQLYKARGGSSRMDDESGHETMQNRALSSVSGLSLPTTTHYFRSI